MLLYANMVYNSVATFISEIPFIKHYQDVSKTCENDLLVVNSDII